MFKSNRPEFFIEKLEKLVWPNIQILPFDEGSAKVYGKLRAEMEGKGTPLIEPDLRIASIAMHRLFCLAGLFGLFSFLS